MNRQEYAEYLKTPEWKDKRLACLKRDRFTCRECGTKQGPLQAHHIRYRDTREMETIDDLVTLCVPCHQKAHEKPIPRVRPRKKKRTPKPPHPPLGRGLLGSKNEEQEHFKKWLQEKHPDLVARKEALKKMGNRQPVKKNGKDSYVPNYPKPVRKERIAPIRFNVGAVAEIVA